MSPAKQISREVFPFLRTYADGTVERYAGTESVPAGFDPETGVLSKDIVISSSSPGTNLSARIYRPKSVPEGRKLPVVLYYHGGAFIVGSPASPMYHHCLNLLVGEANVVAVSVDYRLAPENPLPAAYEDSWAALEWLAGEVDELWLRQFADFEKVFLAGDSAGANIIHHLAVRRRRSFLPVKIHGLVMIHPYFWGKTPIGSEKGDGARKAMVDNWWTFVCPSDDGCDDQYINPFVGGAPAELGCRRAVVFVAEMDILCDRGKAYYRNLVEREGQDGKLGVEMVETKGEDHIFHLFNPDCEPAAELFRNWASFVNRD